MVALRSQYQSVAILSVWMLPYGQRNTASYNGVLKDVAEIKESRRTCTNTRALALEV